MARPTRPKGPDIMKTYGATYQPVVQGGLRDARSTGSPAQQSRKPLLNDRRSTR